MPSIPEIDKIIDTFVTRGFGESPGCSLAVAKDGAIIHSKGYGMADLDQHIKNTSDTVFSAASLSKQFTAMSILLLSDEIPHGKKLINLDNDVRGYIPELRHLPKITIRQLLHHTSGIRDMLIQLTMAGWRWGDDSITRQDVLDLASRMETLNFPPGSEFAYSNTNYFLAGEIVKRVSAEKSLAKFARDNIFEPLGMESTRFVDTYCETVKDRASGYRRLEAPRQGFEKRTPDYDLTGPTNLYTTAEDLLRWDSNFDTGDVGGPDAVAKLQTPEKNSNAYGLGLYVFRNSKGKPLEIYHNGRGIGHRAHFYRSIRDRISIALLCNVEFTNFEATDDLVFAVSRAVQKLSPFRPTLDLPELGLPRGTKKAAALKEYCGTYYSSEIDTAYKVKTKRDSLIVERPWCPDCTLVDFPDFPDDDTFVARVFTDVLREVEVKFLRKKDKTIGGLQVDWAQRIGGSRLKKFVFDKK